MVLHFSFCIDSSYGQLVLNRCLLHVSRTQIWFQDTVDPAMSNWNLFPLLSYSLSVIFNTFSVTIVTLCDSGSLLNFLIEFCRTLVSLCLWPFVCSSYMYLAANKLNSQFPVWYAFHESGRQQVTAKPSINGPSLTNRRNLLDYKRNISAQKHIFAYSKETKNFPHKKALVSDPYSVHSVYTESTVTVKWYTFPKNTTTVDSEHSYVKSTSHRGYTSYCECFHYHGLCAITPP